MKKVITICLFFFCLFLCGGCTKNQGQEIENETRENTEQGVDEEESQETMGQADLSDKEQTEENGKDTEVDLEAEDNNSLILVLNDGGKNTQFVANLICEKMWAVNLDVTQSSKEEIQEWLKQAEYVLIGTEKEEAEFEPYMIKYLDSQMFLDKKVSLFFVNMDKDTREEAEEKMIAAFESYYEDVTMLPSFSMSIEEELAYEEESRMNGWLTSLHTHVDDK